MEARQHDRLWFKEKLQQSNVHTLRGFITAAKVALAASKKSSQGFLHISLTGSSISSGASVLQNIRYMS